MAYALTLPRSYVPVQAEEMEYLDGGAVFETIVSVVALVASLCTIAGFVIDIVADYKKGKKDGGKIKNKGGDTSSVITICKTFSASFRRSNYYKGLLAGVR